MTTTMTSRLSPRALILSTVKEDKSHFLLEPQHFKVSDQPIVGQCCARFWEAEVVFVRKSRNIDLEYSYIL